jgi:hypothetical protein
MALMNGDFFLEVDNIYIKKIYIYIYIKNREFYADTKNMNIP